MTFLTRSSYIDIHDIDKALSETVAVGGTAKVVKCNFGDGSVVAKIYNKQSKFDQVRLEALQVRFAESDLHDRLGIPLKLLSYDGDFIGYTMRYFEQSQYLSLDNWVEQTLVPKLQPSVISLKFRLGVLRSLAQLLRELHERHVAVVDLKPSNILVRISDGSVQIIDCDSFCILGSNNSIEFATKEVTVGYYSSDALRNGVPISELSYEQDNFAFSVIAFQLLNNGLHPYQGAWQIPLENYNLETLSSQGPFPYAIEEPNEVKPSRASIHWTFSSQLRGALDRAFAPGKKRISVGEWASVIDELKNNELETCDILRVSPAHQKFKDRLCSACVYSAYLEKEQSRPNSTVSADQNSKSDTSSWMEMNFNPSKQTRGPLFWGAVVSAIILYLILVSVNISLSVPPV